MPNPLASVAWEECILPARHDEALERFVRRETGVRSPATRYFAGCPWIVRAIVRLSYERSLLTHLDFELADLIALVVSQEHSCRFCYAANRALLRLRGMSESRVEELEGRLSRLDVAPRQRAALAFARRMSRSAPLVGAEERERLAAAGFSREERREIAYVVSYLAFANRVSTIPAIPPYGIERLPDRWLTRLLRPLIARMLAAHVSRGEPAGMPPAPLAPHADLIAAYAGSPIAARLGEALDEAWASPFLTRRCKALLFAVVAQALGCRLSRAAIAPVLASEGLAPAEIDELLSRLDSPLLTAAERALLGFARETVWYQPAAIQRRARALREQLGTDELVEAIGVLSLANALCRLAAAVLDDR
jgi:AhpD family alkylhydroperoxidase